MTDALPDMTLLIPDEEDRAAVGIDGSVFSDLESLAAAHPQVAADPVMLARASNHLSQEFKYEVIEDPAAFESAYRAQLAQEDPSVGWMQGAHRLCDYGLPDFSQIAAPSLENGTLVMFTRDTLTGLPYRVEVAAGEVPGDDAYDPLQLTAVERELIPSRLGDDELTLPPEAAEGGDDDDADTPNAFADE